MRAGGLNRPTEAALATILTYLPHRIPEFLEMLDELAKLYDQGFISFEDDLKPYAQEILPAAINTLAAVLVKNRVPQEALRAMGTVEGLLRYTMVDSKSSYFQPEYKNHPAVIMISQGLLIREADKTVTAGSWENFSNWAGNQELLRDRSKKEWEEYYWKGQRYFHVRAEHAHFLDYGLMEIPRIADTAKRELLTEYQDILERITMNWTASFFRKAEPFSPEEMAALHMQIEDWVKPNPIDTKEHRLARELLARVLPRLVDRVSAEGLPARDLPQLLLWFKMLLLISEDPDFVEELAASSVNTPEFFSLADEWIRYRIHELLQKGEGPAHQALTVYLSQILRELNWVREYFAAHGHMPPSGQAAGLEEPASVEAVPPMPITQVQHFFGVFEDGRLDQIVEDPAVGAHLNTEIGKRQTFVMMLPNPSNAEAAPLPSDIFMLHQKGAEVPNALKGIVPVEFTDLEEVKMILEQRAKEGRKGGVALVAPNITNEEEWDQLFRAYEVTGIRMTPNTLAIINRLSQADIAAFLALIQDQKVGLILETGLEERNGQRRLFLDA